MEGHNQLISLELPHLVGNGLHFKEGIAVEDKNTKFCYIILFSSMTV